MGSQFRGKRTKSDVWVINETKVGAETLMAGCDGEMKRNLKKVKMKNKKRGRKRKEMLVKQ